MVKLNKIYTRTGDAGTTGLVDGSRVAKSDPRMIAIGEVDEANCAIGIAIACLDPDAPEAQMLRRIQNEMFDLGADIATPGEDFAPSAMALRVTPAQVTRLENEIDAMNETLSPLTSFILPGGAQAVAALHLARAISRRAERAMVAAAERLALNPQAMAYINRLSDHLFVLARRIAATREGDILWQPGATRG
ncbi:cob(I)alamin adenosyltransferase [Sphingomonas vulcanisoli]|uniref:Corrinoid adenosyltransferase n=1 Tax=Sphingomonas vulcanisoli TaxID=1658060 RepID=A0ABX0TS70_9SPHN|nr:cob(I)yrinic acid a,c-diamide adenosyltransferase [Sphingomonas vulcanisoli]NIJ07385.1 cob(I)alamin adenosyltransferase [Sphingomonas vulcanisoli]